MGNYSYTDLGAAVAPDGSQVRVTGLHHPAEDDRPAQYELVVEGYAQFDLADPAQRAQVETLIAALQVAVANGESVGWCGSVPGEVTVKRPAVVEWTAHTSGGNRVQVTNE